MRLTPPTKSNFYFSFLMLIMGIVFYFIGTLETFGYINIMATLGVHWLWYLIMAVFMLMAWLLLILGCAWKRF